MKQSQFAERDVISWPGICPLAQDHMVEDFNSQDLAGPNKVASHADVPIGRGWVPARMVVNKDQGGGVLLDGLEKDFPRVDQDGVECSLRNVVNGDQAPPRVDQCDLKCFDSVEAVFLPQQIRNPFRCVQKRGVAISFSGKPLGEKKRAFYGLCAALTNSGNFS